MILKTSAPILEQSCPACGGRFTIGSAGRKKKVQCPQCREVVLLNGTAHAEAAPASPAAPEWLARCEMLQARIDALEQQVEALLVAPRARPPLFAENLADFRAVRAEVPPPDDPAETPDAPVPRREIFREEKPDDDAAMREMFARKYQPPANDIGLLLPAGDGAARQSVEALTAILVRAGWQVRGVKEDRHFPPESRRGLTLAAAPTLPLPRITGTLNALREAGFSVGFQIDPKRGSNETVLIVATDAGAENGDGPAA